MSRDLPSNAEILRQASRMRVADPSADPGAFGAMSKFDMLVLLRLMGLRGVTPDSVLTEDEVRQKVRLALWDMQRLDYLFHGKDFGSKVQLSVDKLPSWPAWREKNPTGIRGKAHMLDAMRDADKLDSFVMRHFQMSAFNQQENLQGPHINPPPTILGAWYGVKNAMTSLAMDITEQGGNNVPFEVFYEPTGNMIVMEILDVKQAAWPEPTAKEWKFIRSCQETKFGHPADGPLVPMMRTPKFPVILVRYAYCEGRPKDGLQYMSYLEYKLQKQPGMTPRKAREELHFHLTHGIEMSEVHLRAWAQLLSANAAFVDKEYVDEQQSHWNGLSREQIKETRISFVAPCLRLRWRALEELETGIKPVKVATCQKCGKDGCTLYCGKCKGVMYCGSECSKADWAAEHKLFCKFSHRVLTADRTLPPDTLYVCVRGAHETILDTGFAIEQETIAQSGCPMEGECLPNEHGAARFMVKIRMPPDYVTADQVQHRGSTLFIVDRRHSLFVRTGPGDSAFHKQRTGKALPFHAAGYTQFRTLLQSRGVAGQLIYLWAKRVGDCLEIDLANVPNQSDMVWE